jgi:tRNA-splicing endonuclease subunit Sen54
MHNVLSFERVHQPKGHTIGIYHPETNMCYAMNPKGPLFIKMGRVLPAHECPFGDDEFRGVRTWLHPEEALYLLERGTMDVRWPVAQDGDDEGEELGLPMSLQAGYAMFLGDEEAHAGGALTFERFTVYSGLKRAGYTVLRAPSWNSAGPALTAECFPPPLPRRTWQTGLFNSLSALKHFFLRDHPPPPQQQHASDHQSARHTAASAPLIPNDLYRNYTQIYRRPALSSTPCILLLVDSRSRSCSCPCSCPRSCRSRSWPCSCCCCGGGG